MVLNPRHMSRPACFDETQEGYDEWRFQLVAYLAAVDPRFGDDVARRTTPYLPIDLLPDEDERKVPHALLSHCGLLRLIMVSTHVQRQTDTAEAHHAPEIEKRWFRR